MMYLYDVFKDAESFGFENVKIHGITDKTSEVEKNDIFICIKGNSFDGHSFAEDMVAKGAVLVVCERDLGIKNQLIVKNSRIHYSRLASEFYGNPAKKLKLIGVTGTNGKTTITNLIKHILNEGGAKTGSIGTMGYDIGTEIMEAHNTTPEPMLLYSVFADMVKNGLEYCVMEVSSQALAQSRIVGEQFECGIFTNLTQDHLDYHGSMENYYLAKRALFEMSKTAVINIDDEYGKRLCGETEIPVITYSVYGRGEFYCENVKSLPGGISYWLSSKKDEKSYYISFKIPGEFNVGNSMAAVAACKFLGMDLNSAAEYIQTCTGVRGRCEVIYSGDFTVICDYAHTADALEKILVTLKNYQKARVICLFGAAGNRDAAKRVPMGEICARLADFLIVTSDNPRHEDPQKILDDVLVGVKKYSTPYVDIVDRREAIRYAIKMAEKDDIVVLAGKGHEEYQVLGDEYTQFNERQITLDIIEELVKK